MEAFCRLFEQLDRTSGTKARVALLADHFSRVPPDDAAWALHCLLGGQRRRLITSRRLREICLEGTALSEWLFEACHAQVGDSAETISLLWEGRQSAGAALAGRPLHALMAETLPHLAQLGGEEQSRAIQALWSSLDRAQIFLVNKLFTGGFRVGVARGLVIRALARVSGLEGSLLSHRLMGGFTPTAEAFEALLAEEGEDDPAASRPYPFFLASPLETSRLLNTTPSDWLVEWKWDGIRGQLIRRQGESFLWSRGEDLINGSFPELVDLADRLPAGTVLDGEVIIWFRDGERPEGFQTLQRRLGRHRPSARLQAEAPALFVAYDLLEDGGRDLRDQPLQERRRSLEALHRKLQEEMRGAQHPRGSDGGGAHPLPIRLSQTLEIGHWDGLEPLRQQARAVGAEGLMLKALHSPYLAGRRRGHWWKHKIDPHRLDAVLLYAQAGSGRRANLFTDYTFGLWDRESGSEEPQLVTFAKAYSGLDDAEIEELDRWIRRHTRERFGPVRSVEPIQVFELAFEGLQPSRRHRSGIAVRFPRISRWRRDKPAIEADTLAQARALMA